MPKLSNAKSLQNDQIVNPKSFKSNNKDRIRPSNCWESQVIRKIWYLVLMTGLLWCSEKFQVDPTTYALTARKLSSRNNEKIYVKDTTGKKFRGILRWVPSWSSGFLSLHEFPLVLVYETTLKHFVHYNRRKTNIPCTQNRGLFLPFFCCSRIIKRSNGPFHRHMFSKVPWILKSQGAQYSGADILEPTYFRLTTVQWIGVPKWPCWTPTTREDPLSEVTFIELIGLGGVPCSGSYWNTPITYVDALGCNVQPLKALIPFK